MLVAIQSVFLPTSDSEVAAVTATDITITESGENWVVSWTESAQQMILLDTMYATIVETLLLLK